MAKWVVKKPYDDSPCEIWRYIETEEQARKYPYISRAIDKYGVDEIVPLAMNSHGGYHTLPKDSPSIIRFIISEETPTIDIEEQYPVNSENIADSWVSPSCVTYTCGSYGHIDCAERLCDSYGYNRSEYGCPADEILFEKGWIKIMRNQWYGHWSYITDRQVLFLTNRGISHYANI